MTKIAALLCLSILTERTLTFTTGATSSTAAAAPALGDGLFC